jgi:hypothetical protein
LNWLPPVRHWEGVLLFFLATGLGLPGWEANAQPLSSVSAAFVDAGVGARTAGLGFAGVASDRGLESLIRNPAAATSLARIEASFAYLDQYSLLGYSEVGAGMSLGQSWGMALFLRDSGDESLRETTFRLSAGKQIGRLSLGLSGALLLAQFGRNDLAGQDLSVFDPGEIAAGFANQIRGDATGVGVDVGLRYAVGRSAVGVAVRNAFAPVSWSSGPASGLWAGTYTESLPMEIVVGAQIPSGRSLLILMDYRPAHTAELDHLIRAGAEWTLAELFAIRVGTERSFNGRDDERYSVGFGVLPPVSGRMRLSANYAYASSFLGDSQQFSLAVSLR